MKNHSPMDPSETRIRITRAAQWAFPEGAVAISNAMIATSACVNKSVTLLMVNISHPYLFSHTLP
jgi:hypothetical protein